MTRDRAPAERLLQRFTARPVSQPHDQHEHEADRAADVVARGGSVGRWSLSAVPASAAAGLQRQEKPKTDEEKKQEALKKAGEAALEIPAVKARKERVLAEVQEDPVVKTLKAAVTSTPGLIATGAVAAGGVTALAATQNRLPFQPPSIPLGRITPGLSAQVKYEGPVNAPTFVGLTLTYKERGPTSKKSAEPDKIAADIARLTAQQQMFKPESQKVAERREEAEAVAAWIASRPGLTVPLRGAPRQQDAPKQEAEAAPVQRAPASGGATVPAHADVDDALTTPGRPLEPAARRTMEGCFGYDFSDVRVHDDERAAATARALDAAAFTVGADVVFGTGRYEPSGAEGGRLLAHELAHVVQQRACSGLVVQRKNGAGAPPPATTLTALAEEDRRRIQVVTASVVVPDLAGKFATTGTTTTAAFAGGVSAVFDASVDPGLQHGLRNVAGSLSAGAELSPAPLVPNSTVTLELDVGGTTGKGLYRFTYAVPAAAGPQKIPQTQRILVESLGKATAPPGTKPSAPPAAGATPIPDPVAEKIKRHSISHSYTGGDLDALRAALDQIPNAQLAVVSGLSFRRATSLAKDPKAAGNYDPKTHTITLFDVAFTASQARYSGPGTVASDTPTRAIVHEIGHAIDLAALRTAGISKDKADAAVGALSAKYPDPKDPTGYQYKRGGSEEKDVSAVLKAQRDAETALGSARSRSGTRSVKQADNSFEDRIGTIAKGNRFREAATKDAPKAVTAYGETDWQEAYAEAYSLYITSPQTLKALRPNVYAYLAANLPI